MSSCSRALYFLLCCLLVTLLVPSEARAEDWPAVSPEELKMTAEPKAPGAPAIYLFRQVDRDDSSSHESVYARVKILTEEGRKFGDVEIPFLKEQGTVRGVQARTIRPDGSVINFDGKVYEKTIVKAKGVKYVAKTFSLPDVQVGSIIEYRYHQDMDSTYVYDSHWILSEELFTRRAKFSLKPNKNFSIRWSWPVGLPQGTNSPKDENGTIRLESENIPAFQIEDFMPPENEMKFRVDFIYSPDTSVEKDSDKFWKQEGKRRYSQCNSFVDKRKAMEEAVSQIVSPTDSPEVKLQEIYTRVQQLRNLSFEREKTEQELKREKQKDINNVEELWKRGYGNGWNITWMFLALARAAGFQADPVLVSTRNRYFFNPKLMNAGELNSNVVVVKLNDKEIYLDPGSAFVPFGMLPWFETAVQGLRLDKDGGTWVNTPLPDASESQTQRKATLQLTDTGSLEGTATFTFTGLEAWRRRLEERNEDDADRKKSLEDEIKLYIPVAIEAELTNKPDWGSSSSTLVAEYNLKVPGWASGAGRRALLAVGLFGGAEKHVFEHADRVHPIYLSYPSQDVDDITIDLPLGWQVNSVPKVQNVDLKAAIYNLTAENQKGSLHVKRQLTLNLEFVETKNYPTLRSFFQIVRTGDEQQIIVSTSTASAGN